MFHFLNTWKNLWHHSGTPASGMPLTEKKPGEKVPYSFPVKKITVDNDIQIAYIDEGEKQAPVLVFIHGMASGVPVWDKNITELNKYFRCIALDLPGHGYSSRGDFSFTMNFYADVVLNFMHKLEVQSATLIGHSMGGQIAIIAALKNPSIVEKLVLAAPAGIEPYTAADKQMLINMATGTVASGYAFTQHRINLMLGFCEDQEAAGELASKLAFFKDEAVEFGKMMLRSIEGMLLEGVNHTLDKITQPCLVFAGKEEKVSPYQFLHKEEYADIVALESAKIKNRKLVVLSPCGHFVQYQRPKSFNKEVLHFLKQKETV